MSEVQKFIIKIWIFFGWLFYPTDLKCSARLLRVNLSKIYQLISMIYIDLYTREDIRDFKAYFIQFVGQYHLELQNMAVTYAYLLCP